MNNKLKEFIKDRVRMYSDLDGLTELTKKYTTGPHGTGVLMRVFPQSLEKWFRGLAKFDESELAKFLQGIKYPLFHFPDYPKGYTELGKKVLDKIKSSDLRIDSIFNFTKNSDGHRLVRYTNGLIEEISSRPSAKNKIPSEYFVPLELLESEYNAYSKCITYSTSLNDCKSMLINDAKEMHYDNKLENNIIEGIKSMTKEEMTKFLESELKECIREPETEKHLDNCRECLTKLATYSDKDYNETEKLAKEYIKKNTVYKTSNGDRLVKDEAGTHFVAVINGGQLYIYYHNPNELEDGSYTEFGYGLKKVHPDKTYKMHWEEIKSGKAPQVIVPADYFK